MQDAYTEVWRQILIIGAPQVGIKTLKTNYLQEDRAITIPYHNKEIARITWSFNNDDELNDPTKFTSHTYYIFSGKFTYGAFSQRGVLCIYAIDNFESFTIIQDIIAKILEIDTEITLFLVANKIDLIETESDIDQSLLDAGQEFAQSSGISFATISGKIGTNVINTFNQLEHSIIAKATYYPISITYFQAKSM